MNINMKTNFPWTTVVVFLIIVAAVVTLIIVGDASNGTITILVGLLPGLLVGTGYAERTARDIRNGVVEQKAKQGTASALKESGVTDVAATASQSTTLAMRALSEILSRVEPHMPMPPVVPPTHPEGGVPSGGQTV